MLQTPHHFYSPDPFERNLLQLHDIPNEGELFYGIIQDGNDFWNATFFCGSCAVIRREALDEVGGIATETVTEDAHTSLRMQKLAGTPPTSTFRRPPAWPPRRSPRTSASAFAGRAAWCRSCASTIRSSHAA